MCMCVCTCGRGPYVCMSRIVTPELRKHVTMGRSHDQTGSDPSRDLVMCRRCGSTRGYVHSKDLEQAQCSRAMDRRTDRAVTRVLQPPLRLIPSFQQQRAFSACSDRPETWQEHRAQVVQYAHSESECVVVRIALNNTKTTLVVFKSLTVRADISELYKRLPRVGIAQVGHPCHVGGCPTSCIMLQGPGAGTHGMDSADRPSGAEVF